MISGIDDVQNGILLTKSLHAGLGRGEVAFIKVRKFHSSFGTLQMQPFQTPNYGLEPNDIKRLDLGPSCTDHITLQQLVKPKGDDPNHLAWFLEWREARSSPADLGCALCLGAHLDVQFRGSPPPSQPSQPSQPPPRPPALILDYAYGVAAFKAWRSKRGGEVHAIMRDYRDEQYAHISPLPRQVDDSDDEPAADDPDYNPGTSLRRGDIMAAEMDKLNSVLMMFHGITPQEAAIRRKKRMEEEELMAQEASRSKGMEWMKTTAVGGSL